MGAALLAALVAGRRDSRTARPPAGEVHALYLAGLDTLGRRLERLDSAASGPGAQEAFAEAREAYKRVEFLVEYVAPAAAEQLNGPALPRMEEDDPSAPAAPPEGFQVMEEALFPEPDTSRVEGLRTQVRIARAHVRRVRAYGAGLMLTDVLVFDALRSEMARIAGLTLSGFDSPVALRSLPEAAAALRGVSDALRPYGTSLTRADPALAEALAKALAGAAGVLDSATDSDRFDRLRYLVATLNPAAELLWRARAALGVPTSTEPRLWSVRSATLFGPDAFTPAIDPALRDLGRRLFFDPALSGEGNRSCGFCHRPDRAFTDGRTGSPPLHPRRGERLRNAPTVINSGLQAGLFYDLRAAYLEDQVRLVVESPEEMHGSLDLAAARLRTRPEYLAAFRAAFPTHPAVSGASIRSAIAGYVRSLTALDAPVDRYLRGDRSALDPSERRGFNLFFGRAKCGTCHFLPLFSGTVPPAFVESESEVLGVPARFPARRPVIDPDEGRWAVTRLEIHRHAFKTPSLRNVALTAPYMHNGALQTLDAVVDFYDGGGGAGLGIELPNQTLPADSLHLTDRDKTDLVRFMRALTDTTGLRP